jgi:hypothetical protein
MLLSREAVKRESVHTLQPTLTTLPESIVTAMHGEDEREVVTFQREDMYHMVHIHLPGQRRRHMHAIRERDDTEDVRKRKWLELAYTHCRSHTSRRLSLLLCCVGGHGTLPGLAPSPRDASATALPFRVHLWHPRVAQKEQRLLGVP